MKHLLVIAFGLTLSYQIKAQAVDVAESTLKVGANSEEVFYYGFAAGDKLIFNFEEANGKEMKEVEIAEYPSTTKFMDYKTKKVESKVIEVQRTGIYKFRFASVALAGRICKFRIQRIPANDATKSFNTTVYWKSVFDTTTTPKQENYLVKSDTTVINVVDQQAKISSQNAVNGNSNKTLVDFTLPDSTIAWSYYIGVGSEGKAAFDVARESFLNSAASTVVALPGYGQMAALALKGLNYFNKVQGEDNVQYWFISDWNSVLAFKAGNQFMQYKQGNVVNDASQIKRPLNGKVYLGLLNDNVMDPIDVMVKVTAITVTRQYDTRIVTITDVKEYKEAYLMN